MTSSLSKLQATAKAYMNPEGEHKSSRTAREPSPPGIPEAHDGYSVASKREFTSSEKLSQQAKRLIAQQSRMEVRNNLENLEASH